METARYDPFASLNGQGVILDPYEADVVTQVARQRAFREAKRRLDEEDLARTFVEPPSTLSLAEELAVEELSLSWTVGGLHPTGANTLLAAQFKVGKTTLMVNLLRCLTDDGLFLGERPVDRPEGRVAFWNYEVSERQFRLWLREAGVRNPQRASAWNLRGHRLPLTVPFVEDLAVRWLVEREVSVLIVDPFSRAYGGEENSNTEVGYFLEALDVIKRRAGVTDLFMAAHFGRGGQEEGEEHVRGATRLDDWADVRWLYRKASTGSPPARYFRADGRDVFMDECRLEYDAKSRGLWISGGSMKEDTAHAHLMEALRLCQSNPGILKTPLKDGISAKADRRAGYITDAVKRGLIREEEEGKQKLRHYLTSQGESFLRGNGEG